MSLHKQWVRGTGRDPRGLSGSCAPTVSSVPELQGVEGTSRKWVFCHREPRVNTSAVTRTQDHGGPLQITPPRPGFPPEESITRTLQVDRNSTCTTTPRLTVHCRRRRKSLKTPTEFENNTRPETVLDPTLTPSFRDDVYPLTCLLLSVTFLRD